MWLSECRPAAGCCVKQLGDSASHRGDQQRLDFLVLCAALLLLF